MKLPKLHIFKTRKGEWMARLVGANDEIIASSEGYSRKFNAIRWRERLVLNLAKAELVESKSDPRRKK